MYTLNNQPDGFIPFLKNRISFESFSFIIKIHTALMAWKERKRPGGEWKLDLH